MGIQKHFFFLLRVYNWQVKYYSYVLYDLKYKTISFRNTYDENVLSEIDMI